MLRDMNIVDVKQPRWHDRVILPKCDKFVVGHNLITIDHHNYPNRYYMNYKTVVQYPKETKHGKRGDYEVYVIPLDRLTTVQEAKEILNNAKELF